MMMVYSRKKIHLAGGRGVGGGGAGAVNAQEIQMRRAGEGWAGEGAWVGGSGVLEIRAGIGERGGG